MSLSFSPEIGLQFTALKSVKISKLVLKSKCFNLSRKYFNVIVLGYAPKILVKFKKSPYDDLACFHLYFLCLCCEATAAPKCL